MTSLTTDEPSATDRGAVIAVVLAAALVALVFLTNGGVDESQASGPNTWTDIAVTLIGTGACAAALVVRRPGRRWGAATVTLLAAFTALQAISIAWSVLPDSSWLASSQAVSYLAAFAGAAALARLFGDRWAALITGVGLALAACCTWSLIVKVFPATLSPNNTAGRLQVPFGYWNALGLAAALALPCWLWIGARREAGRRLAALAAPVIAVLVAISALSYSRSADLAAVVAVALWFTFVPLRLRAVAQLGIGLAGGAVISAWGLAHSALSSDGISLAAQDRAGHTFGVVVLVVLVTTLIAGVACAQVADLHDFPAELRRRVGASLMIGCALIPVVAVVAVALSSRGLTGEISYGWHQLTSTTTVTSNNASRVLAFGSSRPVYWHEGLAVGDHNLLKGVGEVGFAVARMHYSTNTSQVHQAHSFVFETYADLGIIGLALVAALLVAWLRAAARPIALGRAWAGLDPERRAEREGLVTMAVLVVAFGVQSTLDWTWYFPGVAISALLCAGWLAGRGPLTAPTATGPHPRARLRSVILDRPLAALAASVLVVLALLAAWFEYQPLGSVNALDRAVNTGDLGAARAAQRADPFALEPYELLADHYVAAHDIPRARAELQDMVDKQKGNPEAWSVLGDFETTDGDPRRALVAYGKVFGLVAGLDPERLHAAAAAIEARKKLARGGG
jgi:hypothetical protein